MFLLPTKNRLPNLRRFLSAAREMGTSAPGLILVNADEWAEKQADYEKLLALAPPGWTLRPVNARTYGGAIRAVWDEVKDLSWIGLVSDDLVPCSSSWDVELLKQINGWNVVSSNDGWQAPQRMHGATVWSGALARAVGWIFPEGLSHIFHDDVWETLGRETGCWQVRMDIMVKHLHESQDGVIGPTMDPTSALWKNDQARFEEWRDDGERAAGVARIQQLMTDHGVRMLQPDFTGVTLMIATPSHDGRYESTFMVSLFQTFEFMKQHGVAVMLAEEKYTADISLARANIFAAFVRSTATHLLMIDSDMGWSVDAIVRLFCAQKDVVAIAGPKKRYPLQFAANHTDPNGDPINLVYEQGSGTMEVSEVGCAFMLVSRSAADRLVGAHRDLQFNNASGEPVWALFDPIVQHNRHFSEDFAFCRRWCDIGGTVHIVPDISLKHTGFHTFEGNFLASLPPEKARPPQQEAAE